MFLLHDLIAACMQPDKAGKYYFNLIFDIFFIIFVNKIEFVAKYK